MKSFYKHLVKRFDVFALGPSTAIHFGVLFFVGPFLALLGLSVAGRLEQYGEIPWLALGFAALALVAFVVGYIANPMRAVVAKLPKLRAEWHAKRVFWAWLIMFASGVVVKAVRVLGGWYGHYRGESILAIPPAFYSAVGFLDWLAYFALAIAFLRYYQLRKAGEQYRFWQLLAWGTFALEILYALPSCSRLLVVYPIVIWLIVRWYGWDRSWRVVVASAALVLLLVMPYGAYCRHQPVLDSPGKVLSYAINADLSRLDQSLVLQKVIDANLPRLNGETLKGFFVSLGPPRFIWKSKPTVVPDTNELGRRIGAIAPDNTTTSVGPTNVGAWYINFGLWGIVLGMLFTGALYRSIYSYFIVKNNAALSAVLMYAILWPQLIGGLENWPAPVWAGALKVFVMMYILHWLLTRKNLLSTK